MIAALVLSACVSPTPTAPTATPTDMSSERVISAARDHVTMTEVIDVSFGPYSTLRVIPTDRAIDDDRLVWAVKFTGDIEICPPPPGPCMAPMPAFSTVYLDYWTGAFLTTSTVSPG
jgi:hypothetical protein